MTRYIKPKGFGDHEENHDNKKGFSFEEAVSILEEKLEECPDIIMRRVSLKDGKTGFFIYVDGLIDYDLVQRDFIIPILNMEFTGLARSESLHRLPAASLGFPGDIDDVINYILYGDTVFIGEGLDHGIACRLTKYDKRNIDEPVTEKNIRGSHEGFVETLSTNLALLRRRIRNTDLKFKLFTLGASSNQTVAAAYIEGIANPSLLEMLSEKISSINFDGLIGSGYMEQLITDHPNSPFPQYQGTERPDKTVAALLEGKFAVIVDGTPVVLIVPVDFFAFFQAVDDYTTKWMFGSFLGIIRIFGSLLALLLPGLYIAILSFHYYTVPLTLLIPLAESRAKVPFPPIIEALIMEITIEMLREASVRLPTYVGNAIGVVGGLIIGQAAVQAGIVSNLMIIIVAVTAIASYTIPNYDMGLAVRLIRFIIMILASIFGVVGIIVAISFIFVHLISLESLGQPYFQPIMPLKLKDLKDTIIRLPIQFLYKRPDIAQPIDKMRGKRNGRKKK